jgi:hypothetical protein
MRSGASEKDRTVHGLVDCWLRMDHGKRIYVKGVAHYWCFSRPRPGIEDDVVVRNVFVAGFADSPAINYRSQLLNSL